MKKWIALLLVLLQLSGCAGKPADNSPYYGAVSNTSEIFAVLALCGNRLVYLTLDKSDEAGISVMDVSTGKSEQICTLPDYQMNPANVACQDGTLYFNYMTKDVGRKMLAVDTVEKSAKTIGAWEPSTFLGLVYSVAGPDAVYSLAHDSAGCSVIEEYRIKEDESRDAWPLTTVQRIRAISVFEGDIYAVVSSLEKDAIVRYNECGEPDQEWDIREFAGAKIREEQIGHFQFMGDCFYLQNFSGEGCAFRLDGTPVEALTGCSTASDDPSDKPLYTFYRRGTAEPLLLLTPGEPEPECFQPEIPKGFVIRYAYTDAENAARLLLSLVNEETGEERVSILSVKA